MANSTVINGKRSIGYGYPSHTGRLKVIPGSSKKHRLKVALIGDSTLDNGYWVKHKGISYAQNKDTVTHQAAEALADTGHKEGFEVANFAVDGSTTTDLNQYTSLCKVLPADEDHPHTFVHQLNSVSSWKPDVAVLSVAGNNYREALQGTLQQHINRPNLLLRQTPESAKAAIKAEFDQVKQKLLDEYKGNIRQLQADNPQLKRVVLLSQYYPALTSYTPYFIYTGFSHVARAEGRHKDAFEAMESTMNELYREIMQFSLELDKEVVFVDVTSSLNPLGANHTHQIEPNQKGSKIMGRLIAAGVTYPSPSVFKDKTSLLTLTLDKDEETILPKRLKRDEIAHFSVKKINQYIRENRYLHVNHFFAPASSLTTRYESAYHLIMGKDFDSEYKDMPALGLLDLSLITLLASYLWKKTIDQNHPMASRITLGVLSAPILLIKAVVGLALMLALSLPIYAYHQIARQFEKTDGDSILSEEDINGPINSHPETSSLGLS